MFSLNRYIHICHYAKYREIFTWRNSILMALALWLLCFLMKLPNFVGWGSNVYDRKSLNCTFDRLAYSYTLFFVAAGVGIPVALIAYCHYKLYVFVKESEKRVAGKATGLSSKDRSKSVRLARTLSVIFVAYVTCWSPFGVLVVVDPYDSAPLWLYLYTVLLAHSNSCINSVLYGLTNKEFRRGYGSVLTKLTCGRFQTGKVASVSTKLVSSAAATNTSNAIATPNVSAKPTTSVNRARTNTDRATTNTERATTNTERASTNTERASTNIERATTTTERATTNIDMAKTNTTRAAIDSTTTNTIKTPTDDATVATDANKTTPKTTHVITTDDYTAITQATTAV